MPGKVQVSTGVFLLFPAALLLLPLRWVLAWLLAVTVHECGHYLTLRLRKIPIYALCLTPLGITMHTGEMQGRDAVFCALAGPLFALVFTVFSQVFPCTAVCILFQSLFNLLPIYPLDGGRALRAILQRLLPTRWAANLETVVLSLMALFFLRLFRVLQLGILPSLLLLVIFAQKFLANRSNSRYNKEKKRF